MKHNPNYLFLGIIVTLFGCSSNKVQPPNFLIILADDLGNRDLANFPTPNLDKIIDEGF